MDYYAVKVTERPGKPPMFAVQHPHPSAVGKFLTRRWYGDEAAARAFVANVGPKPADRTRVRDAIAIDERDRNLRDADSGLTPTLAQYARAVIADKLADRQTAYSATTHDADEGFIRTHLDRDPFGRMRLGAMREVHARAWVERHYSATSQNGKTFGTLATTTAEKHIRWVRGILRQAIEVDHYLIDNPLRWWAPMPRRDVAPVKDFPALTEVEFARMLDEVRGGPRFAANDRALFAFMFETGLRIAEALALEWSDITPAGVDDEGRDLVDVKVRRQYSRETDTFGDEKTASSNRTVVVGAWVLDLVPGVRSPGAALFIRDRAYNAPLARACARAGVRVISSHGLRHSHATVMRDRGMPVELLYKRLGHKSIATTLAYYVKPSRQAQTAFLSPAPARAALRVVS